MTQAVLALGANLGDAGAALRGAVAGLAAHEDIDVVGVSALWRTAPVGGPDQPEYLNAVVVVATGLQPAELLTVARELESRAGRTRDVRWGPRTLDVDLIDVGGMRRDDPELTLPHPRAHERAFVLAPWLQVAPDATLLLPDGRRAPVADLLARVSGQPVEPFGEGDWWL